MAKTTAPKVLIPLAQGCEELEAVTLIDLLRRAKINVITAGLEAGVAIYASRGVVLLPDTDLEKVKHKSFDMVVLPGGLPGADHLEKDLRIQTLLLTTYRQGGYVAAICAAPKVLARCGLLNGKQAVAYPETLEALDGSHTCIDAPVVVDGRVITSKGPGTAMDFALLLIEILLGSCAKKHVEEGLQRP